MFPSRICAAPTWLTNTSTHSRNFDLRRHQRLRMEKGMVRCDVKSGAPQGEEKLGVKVEIKK
ncbi:MAG: hypothetical protein CM1200mP29_15870 [Verrucomicrobiota bacterium]|nr:MAG: hypothetical protein CM1200mP29_15870 [Verrucomicrobiota bacterium]